jgi:hypothetical protein
MSDEFKETAKTMLKILSGKTTVFFTHRCNESIRLAMLMAASMGKSHGLMQDEGGWLTYDKYITQAGLETIRMVTTDGLIHPKELIHYGSDEVLLINSLAGYIALQKMDIINDYSIQQDILIVNDVSGSIGLPASKFGDIVVGSFGPGKPVDLGRGGFIAFDDEYLEIFENVSGDDFSDYDMDFEELAKKLKGLEKRRAFLVDRCKKIKEDLKDRNIVHLEDQNALNVVIRFKDDDEKQFLEKYCRDNDLEYTVCPREIRIDDDAISIEVKRLKC